MSTPDITIEDGEAYVPQLLDLIKRYTDSLGRDLAFQHLDEELADLTHKYGEGNGRLFAALVDGIVAGVVAYHRFDDTHAEMKRLYVAPEYRGLALGKRLALRVTEAAKEDGFPTMVLDTASVLPHAIAIYHALGFREIPAYYDNPMSDVIYMGLDLTDWEPPVL